jgi:hypothetical protein
MGSKQEINLRRRMTATAIRVASISGASVLLFMAVRQCVEFREFTTAVTEHGLIPASAAGITSAALIVCKLGVSIALLWAEMTDVAAYQKFARCGVAGLLILLAAYVTVLAISPPSKPVSCGCGLSNKPTKDWSLLAARNWGLAAFASALAFSIPKTRMVSSSCVACRSSESITR